MMTQTMVDTFNEQINRELYSAYLYTSMEHWFMKKGLKGLPYPSLQREFQTLEPRILSRFFRYIPQVCIGISGVFLSGGSGMGEAGEESQAAQAFL